MINVLVQSIDDGTKWTATLWPSQQMVSQKANRRDAETGFVTAYNKRHGKRRRELPEEDFRFFGPILTTANVSQKDGKWTVTASADRIYSVTADTEEAAKEAFITVWNEGYVARMRETYPDIVDITDSNVDWTE